MTALSIIGAKWRREVPPSRRLTAREQSLPWAILSFPAHCCRVNRPYLAVGTPAVTAVCSKVVKAGSCRAGPRLVIAARLVKKLRSWRCWHSCQRFRATDHGKKLRRDQAQRYRIRLRQRSSLNQPTPPDDDVELTSPVIEPLTSPVIGPLTSPGSEPPPIVTTTGEGQRPARICEDSCGLPCHRPGCYVLFLPSARSPDQKFCSDSCRQALRRVRQRELRLRQRRRRGVLPRYVYHHGPPQHPYLTSSCIEDVIL